MTTATVRLYELANARDILDEFLAETEGEVTPELQALLDGLEGETTEKVERVALYIRETLVHAKAIKEEADRLTARSRSREKAAEGLKAYLKLNLEKLGKTRIDGLLATVALQNNPPSVLGEVNPDHLRNLFLAGSPIVRHNPESFVLDRKAALDFNKSGGTLPDELTIVQGTHLRIR